MSVRPVESLGVPMSALTLELPVELVLTLEVPPTPALQPAAWLPAAVEALQAFRRPA